VPALQSVLNELNTAFNKEGIGKLAARRQEFAAAGKLGAGLLVRKRAFMMLGKNTSQNCQGAST
jgi:hypothetical protein